MSQPTKLLLSPDLLLRAYAIGIFPMAESRHASEIHWVEPTQRGIIPLDEFHVPRSLRKVVRRGEFEVTVDQDFEDVIDGCAESKPGRGDTWINPTIRRLYIELHRMGYAHSIECRQEGRLVGGLYGVALGGAFFGESMFSRRPDASKVALVHLIAILRDGGFKLLDHRSVLGWRVFRGAGSRAAIQEPDIVDGMLQGREPRRRSEHPPGKDPVFRCAAGRGIINLEEGRTLRLLRRRGLAAGSQGDGQAPKIDRFTNADLKAGDAGSYLVQSLEHRDFPRDGEVLTRQGAGALWQEGSAKH